MIAQQTEKRIDAECSKWQQATIATENVIVEDEFMTTALLDQLQQLYLLFCKRRKIQPQLGRHQIEEQFDFIKDEIEQIRDIISIANDGTADEIKSDVAQCGSAMERLQID